MPRSRPPRTITLLLPSISASSSASSSSDPPGTSTHPSEHNLEVLLRAQKIASERGQYLDITSFMTPSQRLQYLSSSTRYNKSSSSLPLPLPLSSLSSSALSNPLPTIPPPSARHPNEKSDPIPSVTDQAQSDSTNTPPPDSPHQPQPKKPRHLPDLSHLHWKQRQKRLAMIATGEISEDSDLFLEKERDSPGPPVASSYLGRSKGEVDKEAVQKSASYWYAILCLNTTHEFDS